MTDTIPELETVVLRHDVPDVGLRTGDIGAVVHRYEAAGYEVEFVTAGGHTVAVLTLTDADVRSLAPGEILHARPLGPPSSGPVG